MTSGRLFGARLADPAESRYAVEEIAAALRKEGGNVWRAAIRLGVPHRSLCRWIAAMEYLQQVRDAARTNSQHYSSKPAGTQHQGSR